MRTRNKIASYKNKHTTTRNVKKIMHRERDRARNEGTGWTRTTPKPEISGDAGLAYSVVKCSYAFSMTDLCDGPMNQLEISSVRNCRGRHDWCRRGGRARGKSVAAYPATPWLSRSGTWVSSQVESVICSRRYAVYSLSLVLERPSLKGLELAYSAAGRKETRHPPPPFFFF